MCVFLYSGGSSPGKHDGTGSGTVWIHDHRCVRQSVFSGKYSNLLCGRESDLDKDYKSSESPAVPCDGRPVYLYWNLKKYVQTKTQYRG